MGWACASDIVTAIFCDYRADPNTITHALVLKLVHRTKLIEQELAAYGKSNVPPAASLVDLLVYHLLA